MAISRRLVELAMMYPPLKYYEAVKMNVEINLSHGVISGYTTNENARWEKKIYMVCYHLSKWKGKAFQHRHAHIHAQAYYFFNRRRNHNFFNGYFGEWNKMEETELKVRLL